MTAVKAVSSQSQPSPLSKVPLMAAGGYGVYTGKWSKSVFVISLPAKSGSKQKWHSCR